MEKYRKISIGDWHETGKGSNAVTYVCADESMLLKLNKITADEANVLNEYNRCKGVESLGISTPTAYEVVEADGKLGILFLNIKHKKSYSRLIADEPEKMAEYARKFAAECKKLHSTPCDTGLFEGKAEVLRKGIDNAKFISKYKPQLYKLLDKTAECTTCLHGDIQTGNLIEADGVNYWIDFDKFSYGDPILDIAHMYTIYVGVSWLFYVQNLVHMNKKQLNQFWELFMKEYYGFNSEETAEFNKTLDIYNALDLLQKNYTHKGLYADLITLLLAKPSIKRYCNSMRKAEDKQLS